MNHEQVRVLHVDDQPEFTELTATFLERHDEQFSVETATSADEAVSAIDDRTPDCVVSDYNMPGMDGLELLHAVRAEYPDLPFILFTGKGSEAVASEAISAGVTDYLQKTAGSEQYELLANRVRNAVRARREAERADRQEELMRLTEFAGDTGGFELDVETGDVLLTDGADRLLTLPEEPELVFENGVEQFHPDDRQGIQRSIERALRTGEQTQGTWRYQPDDGENRLLELTVTPAADGETTVRGAVHDVTDRRERQRELESERRFVQQALDALDDLFYVADADGSIRRWNSRVPEITGYGESELREMQVADFFPEEEQETVLEGIETVLTDGQATIKVELRTADGERIPYEFTGARLTDADGTTTGLVGIGRDLTERRQREQRFRALVEESNDVISVLDADGVFEYQSPSVERVLGYEPEETVGDTAWEYVHPDDREALMDTFEEWLASPGTTTTVEYRARHADGSWRWMEASGNNQLDNPAVEGYVVNSREITDQIAHRHELERRNERLDEFASIVSHDLRSPLAVAQGRLELAEEDCESEHLARAADAIDRSQALIDDLLTLAQQGKAVAEMEPVGLADVAERSWESVNGGTATLDVDADMVIEADRSRLKQLLENLYRNAVDHAGEGVAVHVGETDDGFYVADDGPGIPESDREAVFEAGYSTADGGTGFGLRIAEQIADAHGWEITVTDGEQGGARFEISGVRTESSDP